MKRDYTDKRQFLAAVRKLATKNKVTSQIMLQEVVLDEILDKIAHSQYKDNLVLKGGFLIASLLGVDTRSTRDIDTSVTGLRITEAKIIAVFTEICQISLPNDEIRLSILGIKAIREDAEYSGFRLHIRAKIFSSLVDVKIDISTGDVITEQAVQYGHKLLLEDRTVQVMAYNVETIIAEKLQTIVDRGELNTRLKDYYDVYMFASESVPINLPLLKKAVVATASNRNSRFLGTYGRRIEHLSKNQAMADLWKKYQSSNRYATGISFEKTCKAAIKLIKQANIDT